MRTRDTRRVEQRQANRETVTAALLTALPTLLAADIPGVLEKARADKGIGLRSLAAHLTEHPDALSSGSSRCPVVVIRLAYVLQTPGIETSSGRVVRVAARSPTTCRASAWPGGCVRSEVRDPR